METFDFDTLDNLNKENERSYLTKFFVPLTNGDHAIIQNGKFTIVDQATIKKTYFNRMSKEMNVYYFKEFRKLRDLTCEIGKDILFDNKLNICPQFKHKYQAYSEFNQKVRSNVDIFLEYVFTVLCSSNKESYDYLLLWLANMIKGNKNDSCVILKTALNGTGKSTLQEFIRRHVLGEDLCLESGSEPLKSRFNEVLAGKLFVAFEELENFSVNEWSAISSVLKRIITSDTIQYEEKNKSRYNAKNLNNYILISNNDCIKDDDGRRYFILDISPHRQKDLVYFGNIRNNCFNDLVGHAFFCMLHELDTSKFNPQAYPNTNSKLDSIAKRLESPYQFLKDEYVLQNREINTSVDDIVEEYKLYAKMKGLRVYGKIDFNKFMKDAGFNYYKGDKKNKYKIAIEKLKEVATLRNWIHELDEFEVSNDEPRLDYETMYLQAMDEIKALKALLLVQVKHDTNLIVMKPTTTTKSLELFNDDEIVPDEDWVGTLTINDDDEEDDTKDACNDINDFLDEMLN